jgi:hypothetical protein
MQQAATPAARVLVTMIPLVRVEDGEFESRTLTRRLDEALGSRPWGLAAGFSGGRDPGVVPVAQSR